MKFHPVWRDSVVPWAAAAASAGLLASAFPPVSASANAWLAFVPLLILGAARPRESFRWGFRGGLLFWLLSISWLLRLWKTGNVPLAGRVALVGGWAGLAAYCALYTGAFLRVAGPLIAEARAGGSRARSVGLVFLVPLLWVGFEYVRGRLFSGFPWNQLGVSQYRNLPLIQIAAWGGVHAVSAVVMCLNTALALTVLQVAAALFRRPAPRVHLELMAGLLVCVFSWMAGMGMLRDARAERSAGTEVRVAAVQPNVAQDEKWPEDDAVEDIHQRLRTLTELSRAGSRPDLVVWPETAVPGFAGSGDASGEFVRALAAEGAPLLVGSMEYDEAAGGLFYNSAMLFDRAGPPRQVYRKRHLVPFGEYIPLDKSIRPLKRIAPLGFSCTPGTTSTVFRLQSPAVTFSALICFEDTVAWLSRRSVLNGAGFLVNQTNDAWFDGTAAPEQHMTHCVFRCVENRVDAVRSANTGVTCFIRSTGEVEPLDGADPACGAFAVGRVMARGVSAVPTRYTRFGDAQFAAPCAALALLSLALVARRASGQRRSASPANRA